MKPRLFPSSACSLIAICLFLAFDRPAVQAKPIRLRNEVIPAEASAPAAANATSALPESPVSGLFLVQFSSPPPPQARAQLSAAGVDLLHYVPEDAFVARLRNARLGQLRALPSVQWVGEYRPAYKVHPRLAAAARGSLRTNLTVAVNVLIAAQAAPGEIAQARSLFSTIAHESHLRQGILLQGGLAPGRLDALAQVNSVLWIEHAPRRKLVDEMAAKLVGGDDGFVATPTVSQQLGFDGSGVTVCVADTGLDTGNTNNMHPDLSGRVTGFLHYGTNILDGSDGYGHGTHVAGIVAGNAATGETDPDFGTLYGLGVASHANLLIQRIFDDEANPAGPFPSDDTLTGDAVRNGADIGSNSWGNDVQGEYDTDAWQFDQLVRDADPSAPGDQPYILEFSSGNAGPDSQTVGSPATGKNVIATGASENAPGFWAETYGLYADGPDTMADFSSRGPCEDGRIKPDVVAPGTWIASAASSAAPDLASVSWTPIDNYYVYMGGTSMSGPHASGAAAVFVQYYKSLHTNATPSPALVKAALINSANELDQLNGGPGPIPNFEEGWGRITLTNIIFTNLNTAPRYYQYLDQTTLLTNGQVFERHTLVQSPAQPLKITLAYTDVAGFPGAIPALVNDLDLEVIGPDGTLYRGNQFAGSDSAPNAPSPDSLNNVEAVHLTQPLPGDYRVRVRASHVVQDALPDATAAIDQDFALVISGDLARPGVGSVLLDRPAYTAPGVIQLTVFDTARAANNTVSVLLKSTTEASGENVVLHSAGNYGAFTGTVATVMAVAAADGKLEIHHGDAIQAEYTDSSGARRVATAVADLVPPTISGVSATIDLGLVTLTWQTSEPANAIVRYGTNLTFNLAVTNSALTTSHIIRLGNLVPGSSYSFYVVAADVAGNTTTNNNAGAYFTFVGVATPTVLLVDAYDPVSGSPLIPDSTYTNALAAAGFSFAHWKVSARGSPQLSDLQPFPAVIWRLIDDVINYGYDADGLPDPAATNNTLSAQQQFMIQNYLNRGGSFFMASMEILSRLGNVAFRKNVLQVSRFKQNPDPLSSCADCDEDFGVPAILGAPGNPITSGIALTNDYSLYPSIELDVDLTFGPDFSDTFTPATKATPILFELASGRPCGMSFPRVGVDSPGRVAFLSFPLETVPANGIPPNTEAALLRNILKFLTPGVNGVGSIFLNNSVYSVPDQITVEVGDSDLAGIGPALVTFSTSSSASRVTVALNETTRPGLFRGFLTLAATSASNQLAVRNGDTVTATYFDASNNSNVFVNVTIDAVSPVISQVSAVTGFGDATVTWHTSKPADSLVQYGESVLLGRTAYAEALATDHTVTVAGLQANRDYFYQVASRDQAGNTTVDNNTNALYRFTTRRAPQLPWSDDLEGGAGGWTVVADPAYPGLQWTLGTPNNGPVTSAHSGTNAWGSDLYGEPIGLAAHSFLVSPVIDLSGVSQAILTFWDCFNFSSMSEEGQMRIITTIGTPPASAPVLQDFSGLSTDGWEQESVSLAPYVGRTVQLVWEYVGVFSPSPQGWLVDDVSITGVAGSGTIVISKNLGQGKFTLTGLIGQSGTALSTTVTNAPPGPYSVHFTDVAFYQTPPDQSLTLANGSTITFTGNYNFIDINRNGISDSWERYYFGSATTNRTQFTDSDGDGMSDYAEFIAGTNPTNAASRFVILSATLQTNKLLRLQWAAVAGRLYQVQASALLSPQVSPTRLSGSVDKLSGGFTLHIDAPANSPYAIQVSSNLTAWTSFYTNLTGGKLDYVDSQAAHTARRYYRTLSLTTGASTNLAAWAPISDWLQASGSPMSYTTTNANQGSYFYRVQVRP